MSQHDYILDNQTGAASRADLNNLFQAIATLNSGAAEPATTYAYQLWMDTTTGILKQRNSANTAWINLKGSLSSVASVSAVTTLDSTYIGKLITLSGTTYTTTLPAANAVLAGDTLSFKCTASGDITIARAGSDTIGIDSSTATSIILRNGQKIILVSNGSNQWSIISGMYGGTTTPTITAGSGTFTTVSATLRYTRVGNLCHFTAIITDTNNGTAGTYVVLPLPFTPVAGIQQIMSAFNPNTNVACPVRLIGGTAAAYIFKYDGTFPIATGQSLEVTGVFEVA